MQRKALNRDDPAQSDGVSCGKNGFEANGVSLAPTGATTLGG
jgi:hypothetical protein